ncbi:hypothetical protein MF479_005047, partial [Escherichia coli]|nr:hypothetical protein [Escherichia coli]
MKYTSVHVCCPGNIISGGPELLHQFVHELRQNGVDAHIIYFPFEQLYDTPALYSHYDIAKSNINEIKKEDIVFIPETATYLINRISCENIAIWWLSIDFYYGCPVDKKISPLMLKHYVDVWKGKKLSFSEMKKFQHFHQSYYAKDFLSRKGIISKELSDYLNDEFIKTNILNRDNNRKKIIAYNPKKGIKTTNRLIKAF